jgi:hypothetical protein
MRMYAYALVALFPLAAQAGMVEEERYVLDREQAIAAITSELRQRCLSDFSQKGSHRNLTPLGSLAFNDTLSRVVYDTIYWRHSDRGVAFTMPVRADNEVGNVGCFYAVTDKGLEFQLSQQIHWHR